MSFYNVFNLILLHSVNNYYILNIISNKYIILYVKYVRGQSLNTYRINYLIKILNLKIYYYFKIAIKYVILVKQYFIPQISNHFKNKH